MGSRYFQSRQGFRAYSSGWLERTPDKREVGGSIPPRPTALGRIVSLALVRGAIFHVQPVTRLSGGAFVL